MTSDPSGDVQLVHRDQIGATRGTARHAAYVLFVFNLGNPFLQLQ